MAFLENTKKCFLLPNFDFPICKIIVFFSTQEKGSKRAKRKRLCEKPL